MKIKIVSCTVDDAWYKDKIGDEEPEAVIPMEWNI